MAAAEIPYYLERPEGQKFAELAGSLSDQIEANRAQMDTARANQRKARDTEAAAIKTQGEAMRPPIQAARDTLNAPLPAPPATPEIAPPPSRKLTDFLAPVAGESPENTITKLIQGVGLMAAGITGLKRGDARAALAGLHGALKGWQEGDKERADRAFADWDAAAKTVVGDWERRHKVYRDLLEDRKLTVDQKLEAVKLAALEEGHDVAVATFNRQSLDQDLQWLREDRDALLKFQEHRDRLDQAYQLRQMQFGLAEQGREQARAHWLADYQQRERLAAQRIEAGKETKADKKLPGHWFDRTTGERAYPSEADFHSPDFAKRFHEVSLQDATRYMQIKIALPMIDRLRQLVPKLLADQPVQNLVKAAELSLQGKTSGNPDLREFEALVKDTNVKMTSVMGPGQFRVTLLHVLQGAGLTKGDTKATAGRLLDQWETNIENDLAAITGQPLRAHLSGPWRGYAISPEGQRKVVELKQGERMDPGWKPAEEIK